MDELGLTSYPYVSSQEPNWVFQYKTNSCLSVGKFFLLEPLLLERAGGFTNFGCEPIYVSEYGSYSEKLFYGKICTNVEAAVIMGYCLL